MSYLRRNVPLKPGQAGVWWGAGRRWQRRNSSIRDGIFTWLLLGLSRVCIRFPESQEAISAWAQRYALCWKEFHSPLSTGQWEAWLKISVKKRMRMHQREILRVLSLIALRSESVLPSLSGRSLESVRKISMRHDESMWASSGIVVRNWNDFIGIVELRTCLSNHVNFTGVGFLCFRYGLRERLQKRIRAGIGLCMWRELQARILCSPFACCVLWLVRIMVCFIWISIQISFRIRIGLLRLVRSLLWLGWMRQEDHFQWPTICCR